MAPDLIHHPLSRADGSTIFSDSLYAIIASVNGPIEVQRRDELPEQAAIEVNIRPASGVGGPKERWLETVLQSVLKNIILVHMHPRTLAQITLQVTKEPGTKLKRMVSDISVIPTLFNAAFVALVDSGLPLATTACATLAIIDRNGEVVSEPQEKDLANCTSIHALAYNTTGDQLLDQSSGDFDLKSWEKVMDTTREVCVAAMTATGEDDDMANGGGQSASWLRKTLHERVKVASSWREAT